MTDQEMLTWLREHPIAHNAEPDEPFYVTCHAIADRLEALLERVAIVEESDEPTDV
jgi:hypothetical protein